MKGFEKRVSGEIFHYHSPLPMVGSALLVRSLDRSGFIEWETEPVPIDFKDEFVTFMWMAGIDVSEDGKGIMLRLFNAGGRPERARLHWDQKRPGVLYLSSPFEDKGKRINGPIQLSAYGIITIRAEGFN